jgi:hypothetical protein
LKDFYTFQRKIPSIIKSSPKQLISKLELNPVIRHVCFVHDHEVMQSSSSSNTSLSSSTSLSTHEKSDHIQILANMDIFLAICDKISKFLYINHI